MKPTNVQFESGMSMPAYQARPEISASDLKRIGQDPAAWHWEKQHPTPPTTDQVFGSAVHAYALEPDDPENGIVETRFTDWKTAEAREIKTQALAAGQYPLREQDIAKAKVMASAIRTHPRVARILSSGEPELSFFGVEGFTPTRGRVDWLNHDARIILDLKTARSVHVDDFNRAVYDHGYHISATHYRDHIAARYGDPPAAWTVILAAIAKHPPYEVRCFELSEDWYELGQRQKENALWFYRRSVETGHWGYGQETQVLDPTTWQMAREGLA